jgi:predicted MPP superfamily phosphohydrolase
MLLRFALFFLFSSILFAIIFIYVANFYGKIFNKWKSYLILFVLFCFSLFSFYILRFFDFYGFSPKLYVVFNWVSYVCLGFFSMLFMLTVLFHLAFYFSDRFHSKLKIDQSRRKFLGGVAIFSAFALSSKAIFNVLSGPFVKKIIIESDKINADLESLKILQLSDLHIGLTIAEDAVNKIIQLANEQEPDIVVITGDIQDGYVKNIGHLVKKLNEIKNKYGIFYVTGNHEYYWNATEWIHFIESGGGRFLKNEHCIIKHKETEFILAGVHDYQASQFGQENISDPSMALKGLADSKDLFKIILAHQPKSAWESEKAGFDLQISGHTHGGQYFPMNYLIHIFQPFVAGLYNLKSMQLYVNSGTGYWGPPFRLGTRGEITVFSFRGKNIS